MARLTAQQMCNQYGLMVKDVVEMTGRRRKLLQQWYLHRPDLFEIVVLGCAKKKELENENKKD